MTKQLYYKWKFKKYSHYNIQNIKIGEGGQRRDLKVKYKK